MLALFMVLKIDPLYMNTIYITLFEEYISHVLDVDASLKKRWNTQMLLIYNSQDLYWNDYDCSKESFI